MWKDENAKKGFTLVELLIVVAIMGLMLTIGIPATQSAIDYANKKECQTNQRILAQNLNDYKAGANMSFEADTHKRWEPGSYDPATHTWTTWNQQPITPAPVYYYNGMRSAISCADYGEYFMRQFYGGENSTLQLPSTEEGCQLYIIFHKTEAAPEAPFKCPKGYVEIRCTNEKHCTEDPFILPFGYTP